MEILGRQRLTPLQRTKIAYSQQYRCSACDHILEPLFHVDHILPLSQGGSNMAVNLQALCQPCHIDKTRLEVSNPDARICNTCHTIYSKFFTHKCQTQVCPIPAGTPAQQCCSDYMRCLHRIEQLHL